MTKDSRLSIFKFEVYHGRPHGTDNRFLAFEPHIKYDDTTGYTVHTVAHGSRAEIVKAFAQALEDLMPDDKVEVFQTHTLPQYVHEYFGCSRRGTKIEMRRDPEGFSFHGPKLSILVKKKHAHSARDELTKIIKRKLTGDDNA